MYTKLDMHDPRLTALDGSLLLSLKELLESESVTVAARRLGTTQPSMSRTLGRLRELFGDPLLEPLGRGLARTSRAESLLPRVEAALGALRSLTSAESANAPAEEKRLVRIAGSDYASVVVLAPWLARLRREAKGIVVHVESVGASTIEPLAYGELDLALAPRIPVAGLDQFVFRHIVEDRLVCAVRRGHPSAAKRLTLERYLALEHVMVGISVPAVSAVQVALHRIGRTRNVVAKVPSFSTALDIVAASDLAVAVPERMLAACGRALVSRPLPFAVEPITLSLVWHPRRTSDPFHRWIREGIERSARPRALPS